MKSRMVFYFGWRWDEFPLNNIGEITFHWGGGYGILKTIK